MERPQPLKLIATPLNFTHKAACAGLFGYYSMQSRSFGQLGALCAAQVTHGLKAQGLAPHEEAMPRCLGKASCNTPA
jgi:hypothetical protein